MTRTQLDRHSSIRRHGVPVRPDWARPLAAIPAAFLASLIGLIGMVALAAASPASAHTPLLSITPKDGSTLSKPPAQVVLTFEAAPLDGGLAVVAVGDGRTTPLEPAVEGNKVVAPWPAELASGAYQVNWRAVSGDGHPVTGSTRFTITGTTASPSASTPSGTPSGTPSSGQAPAVPGTSAGPTAAPGADGTAPSPLVWAGLAALLAAGVAAVVVLGRRRGQ